MFVQCNSLLFNMLKKCFLLLGIFWSYQISADTYNIKTLGADASGKKLITELINKTIDLAYTKGGGTIYIPSGTYLTGPLTFKSNITLYLEAGAILKFTSDFKQYLPFKKVRFEGVFMNSFAPLINANNAENISIKGEGVLEGNGFEWWDEIKNISKEVKDKGKVENPNELQKLWSKENADLKVEPYYDNTLKTQFFRPPFIQFLECKKVKIEGVTIQNSPFWTINPVGCDDVLIQGVTILNPATNPHGPNTDGINPSSCRNVRISNCFISVGDDCITIKSGRDFHGRNYGKPCENITITNCVMLSGHGGVVIGSEMSGGVKNVVISNCVFDGTDSGIRLKASRGRGGIVENIRVSNIVMRNIGRNAFSFNLFYDRNSVPEPVTERTPIFRNIHIENVTGEGVNSVGFIRGIEEMPISDISFTNITVEAKEGFKAHTANNIQFSNVDIVTLKGSILELENCESIVFNDIKSKSHSENQALITILKSKNILINNCFQKSSLDVFVETDENNILMGNNFFSKVKTPVLIKN